MKTERKGTIWYFMMNTGGDDYKYYKIANEEDLLEAVKDEQTGQTKIQRVNKDRTDPIKVVEITAEEYYRMKENNNGENQEG